MLEIDDILTNGYGCVRRIIDIQEDYVIALLQSDRDGAIDQDEDNIAEFILKNDIYENQACPNPHNSPFRRLSAP